MIWVRRALGWRVVNGHTSRTKPPSPEVGATETVAFAALAGALFNVARAMATRQAEVYWARRHSGAFPEAQLAAS